MIKTTLPLITLAAMSVLPIAQAETHIIFADDFSTLDLDRVFTNQDRWWGPNWNAGDIVQTRALANGPDGKVAVTRTTQVLAGRFYGGGLRGPTVPFSLPSTASGDIPLSDVTMSFWVRGTSSAGRGPLGVAVFSKDSTGANTGAAYYLLPIVPAQWTQVTVSFADMAAGAPNIAPADTAFNFSSPQLQVFFFMRTDYEDGWPFQEDENHTYSVSVADIRIEATISGEPEPTWAGYPIVDGWVDTGDWLGWLYVDFDPWIYSHTLKNFMFFPDEPDANGAWMYVLR